MKGPMDANGRRRACRVNDETSTDCKAAERRPRVVASRAASLAAAQAEISSWVLGGRGRCRRADNTAATDFGQGTKRPATTWRADTKLLGPTAMHAIKPQIMSTAAARTIRLSG